MIRTKILGYFVVIYVSSLTATLYGQQCPQVVGWNFDWDDNIMFMPTAIVLFQKETGKEIQVETGEFATHRTEIGSSGKYANYELRSDRKTGSFRNFSDLSDPNVFKKDVNKAMSAVDKRWRGPSWNAFIFATRFNSSAKWTTIITARGHNPETIFDTLKDFRDQKIISYLPKVEGIYPVSNPEIGGEADSPSAAKTEIMKRLLDRISSQPIDPKNARQVLNRSGNGHKKLHLWGFSDDDKGNFDKAKSVLSKEVKKGRWPNVKIVLYYTSTHDEKERVSQVIQPDGSVRSAKSEEFFEGILVATDSDC